MRNSFEATGYFLGAGQIKTVGQNNTKIRVFWLDMTDRPEFPNTPEFQLRGDKVHLVDNIPQNTELRVKFNLNGRKYDNTQTGKKGVIVNIDAWQITIVTAQSAAAPRQAAPVQQPAPAPRPAQPAPATTAASGNSFNSAFDDENNDLPF